MKENFVVINQLSVPSDFSELVKVEGLIDDVCSNYFADQDIYGNVLIAVTEAVNNAIQHGNSSDNRRLVTIGVSSSDEQIDFSVSDEGRGFDYANLPDPTAPENIEKENGRGIFLMRSLSDGVEFENGGSTVVISFKR